MAYALALLAAVLVGAGYLLGSRRARSREAELKTTLDERTEKLTLVEHELLHQSAIDPVTGLRTQQYFQEFLEREWRRASREHKSVAVIMVEVDHFRAFNERQGKPQGDASLKSIAAVLKPMIHRAGDVIARYGGSGKFGIVLGGTDGKGASALAEYLRTAVEQMQRPNPASPSGTMLTITLGVAAATPVREGAWQDLELIAAAERALAHAREAGRNTVVLDTPESAVR
ncbi:MAG TPA: diguanylate cyclase [Vicinamibacterales bacterium]|nr:diguanylate cyclase [Vicinamibacterales bacterium]